RAARRHRAPHAPAPGRRRLAAPLPRLGLRVRLRCAARNRRRDHRDDERRLRHPRDRGARPGRARRGPDRRDVRIRSRGDRPRRGARRLPHSPRRVPSQVLPPRAHGGTNGRRRSGTGGRRSRRDAVTRLEAYGIGLDVPDGWEARAFRHAGGEPTIHLATFALPPSDGEFGTRATARMGADAVFVCLTEYVVDDAELTRGIFAGRPPKRLAPDLLRPNTLLRPVAGQLGVQRFFSLSRRAFCLYVVVGRGGLQRLDGVNGALASLAVAPR